MAKRRTDPIPLFKQKHLILMVSTLIHKLRHCIWFCALPLAVLQQYMQFTSVSRKDFRIHQGFQCVQYCWFNFVQPGLQRVHLLTQIHLPFLRNEPHLCCQFTRCVFLFTHSIFFSNPFHLVLQYGLQCSELKRQRMCL